MTGRSLRGRAFLVLTLPLRTVAVLQSVTAQTAPHDSWPGPIDRRVLPGTTVVIRNMDTGASRTVVRTLPGPNRAVLTRALQLDGNLGRSRYRRRDGTGSR